MEYRKSRKTRLRGDYGQKRAGIGFGPIPTAPGVLVHQVIGKQAKVEQDKHPENPHEAEESGAMVG